MMKYFKTYENFEPRNIEKREKDMKAMIDKKIIEINKLLDNPKFKEEIEYSIHASDINDALVHLQNYLGVESGDTASMHFSDHDCEEVWQNYTPEERLDVLVGYIAREINVEYINIDGMTGTVAAGQLVRDSFVKHGLFQ